MLSQRFHEDKIRALREIEQEFYYNYVEVPFNEKFSILYEHHCPWWLSENNKYCLQFLSFGGEFRWWFKPQTRPETEKRVKRDALVGHFLGLYGWGGKLDFQNVRKICYQAEFNSLRGKLDAFFWDEEKKIYRLYCLYQHRRCRFHLLQNSVLTLKTDHLYQ